MAEFQALSPGTMEGHVITKSIVVGPFDYAEVKCLPWNMDPKFLRKTSVGEGISAI